METIIGLLFIFLPVIFKLIEKKLQDSGKTTQAGKIRELAELFEEKEESVYEEPETLVPVQDPVIPIPEPEGEPMGRIAQEKLKASVQKPSKVTPILVEEPKTKKKEKIDPKKLVIYSEIMKPKYQD